MHRSTCRRALCILTLCALLAGCDDTPVRYSVCDASEKNCMAVASFKTHEECDRYKRFHSASCDWSTPGRIVCDTTARSITGATSHCSQ